MLKGGRHHTLFMTREDVLLKNMDKVNAYGMWINYNVETVEIIRNRSLKVIWESKKSAK